MTMLVSCEMGKKTILGSGWQDAYSTKSVFNASENRYKFTIAIQRFFEHFMPVEDLIFVVSERELLQIP